MSDAQVVVLMMMMIIRFKSVHRLPLISFPKDHLSSRSGPSRLLGVEPDKMPPLHPVAEQTPNRSSSFQVLRGLFTSPQSCMELQSSRRPLIPQQMKRLQRHGARSRALAKLRTRLDRTQLHSKAERPILGIKPQVKGRGGAQPQPACGGLPTAIFAGHDGG